MPSEQIHHGLGLVKDMFRTTVVNFLRLLFAFSKWTPFIYFQIFYLTLKFEDALKEAGAIFSEQDLWIKAVSPQVLSEIIPNLAQRDSRDLWSEVRY